MAVCFDFEETLCRVRGDSCAHEFVLTDENDAPIDITGFTFLFTVDTLKNPPDNTTNVWTLVGTITNALTGEFEFVPTAVQADLDPATKYFYDMQFTDASGRICTRAKGKYDIEQDITK